MSNCERTEFEKVSAVMPVPSETMNTVRLTADAGVVMIEKGSRTIRQVTEFVRLIYGAGCNTKGRFDQGMLAVQKADMS